jgi:rhodanese-related sulfurtransferase
MTFILKPFCFAHVFLYILLATGCWAQEPATRAHCGNPKFDQKVASWLRFSVPTVTPEQVKAMPQALRLDTREQAEFDVSHLPNALCVGYNKFDEKKLSAFPRDTPIVVYCSIGYRSEKVGEKLQKMGFTRVFNLYGSIFEWVNQGNTVVDKAGKTTSRVHTFNNQWGKWVESSKAEKVH